MRSLVLLLTLFAGLFGCGGGGNTTTPSAKNKFTVGGTLTGLSAGNVVLEITGGERVTVTRDGQFTFPTPLEQGASYTIRVVRSPDGPQVTLQNATGTVGANVSDVRVVLTPRFRVGGVVRGLSGTLVLQLNGGDDLTLTKDGPFTFPTWLADGTSFAVTTKTTPAGVTCTIANATGKIARADVTNVTVTCGAVFTVGGTVTGLNGTLVLQLNGADDLTVTANGPFTFGTGLPTGTAWAVTARTVPGTQRCTITAGSGTIGRSNVTNVDVRCVSVFTIGGTVRGLNGTVVIRNNGGDDLTLTSDGPFAFATPLGDGANYDVTIQSRPGGQRCTVGNGSGTVSGQNVSDVTIDCTNKSWTHPRNLTDNMSPDGTHSYDPIVESDRTGVTIVGWHQSDRQAFQIFKSEYRNGTWRHPASLADNISPDTQNAFEPRIAFNRSGGVAMVWYQNNGLRNQIFKSEYQNGAWAHPASLNQHISPVGESAYEPAAAYDVAGNAIVVWRQHDGQRYQVFKSEYRNGTWTHPANTSDNIAINGQDAFEPQVAFDPNGNAAIVWYQSNGSHSQIFKSEYRNGTWTHPANLNDNISPDGQSAYDPQVAFDASGNAIVVWYQNDGARNQIFKSEYRNGTWTHPASLTDNISPDGQHAYDPRVAIAPNGDATIVWYQNDGSRFRVFKSERRGGTWTHPTGLSDAISLPGQDAFDARIAIDREGNVVVVWYQNDSVRYQIYKSEYRNGRWTHPADLRDNISPDGQDAYQPEITFDGNDDAVVVWRQLDGSYYQIYKSEYR